MLWLFKMLLYFMYIVEILMSTALGPLDWFVGRFGLFNFAEIDYQYSLVLFLDLMNDNNKSRYHICMYAHCIRPFL